MSCIIRAGALPKQSVKLLVVDDHVQFRGLMKGIVGDLFTRVYEADNGVQAVDYYAKHKPDWVLMDIRMKSLNGLQAASRITQDFPEARIVMVTNYCAPELQTAARQAGAWGYVLKDDLNTLREMIVSGVASPWPSSE